MTMTDLVACLGAGKGTWNEVVKLIRAESWGKVFLVTNDFGKAKFSEHFPGILAEFVIVDDLLPTDQVAQAIANQLQGKTEFSEVAVNMASGSGNLHMALLAALLKLGAGIRLVVTSEQGVKEL